MVQAGGLAGADAVLDAGVGAVAGFDKVEPAAGGVGGQELVAPAVGLFEQRELRSGCGAHSRRHSIRMSAGQFGRLSPP